MYAPIFGGTYIQRSTGPNTLLFLRLWLRVGLLPLKYINRKPDPAFVRPPSRNLNRPLALERACDRKIRSQFLTLPPLAQSSPICSAPISQTVRTKQKRPQDCKAKAKRLTKHLQTSHPPSLELFGKDLQQDSEAKARADNLEPPPLSKESEEDIKTLYKAVMSSVINKISTLKRTSSRRSIVPSETDTVRSQRSSNTTAHYRYKHLEDANVYIHIDPPEDVQAAIENIINANPSEDCHAILRDKAKNFSKRCKEMVRVAAGEDDFVHLFYILSKILVPISSSLVKKPTGELSGSQQFSNQMQI